MITKPEAAPLISRGGDAVRLFPAKPIDEEKRLAFEEAERLQAEEDRLAAVFAASEAQRNAFKAEQEELRTTFLAQNDAINAYNARMVARRIKVLWASGIVLSLAGVLWAIEAVFMGGW